MSDNDATLANRLLAELSRVAAQHCSHKRRHYCDYHQGYADAIDVLASSFEKALRLAPNPDNPTNQEQDPR